MYMTYMYAVDNIIITHKRRNMWYFLIVYFNSYRRLLKFSLRRKEFR